MWLAWAVVPLVPPIVFILQLPVVYLIASTLGVDVNHASFVVLPFAAMTFGLFVSYAFAGLIGVPLAFFLRNRGRLHAISIYCCAFGFVVMLAVISQSVGIKGGSLTVVERLRWAAYVSTSMVVPILTAATVFWSMVRPSAVARAG